MELIFKAAVSQRDTYGCDRKYYGYELAYALDLIPETDIIEL